MQGFHGHAETSDAFDRFSSYAGFWQLRGAERLFLGDNFTGAWTQIFRSIILALALQIMETVVPDRTSVFG